MGAFQVLRGGSNPSSCTKMSTPLTKEILADIESFIKSARKYIDDPKNSGNIEPIYLLTKRLNKALEKKNVRKKK